MLRPLCRTDELFHVSKVALAMRISKHTNRFRINLYISSTLKFLAIYVLDPYPKVKAALRISESLW